MEEAKGCMAAAPAPHGPLRVSQMGEGSELAAVVVVGLKQLDQSDYC